MQKSTTNKRNKMNETETPRTDERYWRDYGKQPNPPTGDEMRDFAHELGRELTAVTEQRDRLLEQRDVLRSGIGYASDQLIKVTEQRDRLAEALESIIGEAAFEGIPESKQQYIYEALQSLNQPTKL
jgi:hypothetical protein